MSFILVGYDGSAQSVIALRWAVRECRIRKLSLTICHAWSWNYDLLEVPSDLVERMAQRVLDTGAGQAADMSPQLKIRKVLMRGPASAALLHEALDAVMVVLGARGTGGFDGLPAGSTATQVAGHAFAPVVIVRHLTDDPRIVIGVDGSPASDKALAFGFEEAVLRRLRVEAVHASTDGDQRAAAASLERQVAPWRTKFPTVEAFTRLLPGPPRESLLEAADGAALLVVGDRGTAGVKGLALGAVSQALLQQSTSSIAVVPTLH